MSGSEIVKIIEQRLISLNMKKKTFFDITGISSASLSQWRNEKSQPSPEALRKINDVLGTNFEIKSAITDSILDSVKMLQQLRDEDRILLQVARDMTPQQVQLMTEFGRTIKRIGKGEETD